MYGSSNIQHHISLWDLLCNIAEGMAGPWSLVGDFNSILHLHDHHTSYWSKCDVIDDRFQGPGNTGRRGSLLECLDKVLTNLDWRIRFPNALVLHLSFFKSNHRGILIKMTNKKCDDQRRRPFRFVASWLMHDDFDYFLKDLWKNDVDWKEKVEDLQMLFVIGIRRVLVTSLCTSVSLLDNLSLEELIRHLVPNFSNKLSLEDLVHLLSDCLVSLFSHLPLLL